MSNRYLSLDGIMTEETRAWGGEKNGLPPGDYLVRVTEAGDEDPTKNQNPQCSVQYEVLEGEQKGRKARCWYILTEKAIGRLKQLLDATGVEYRRPGGGFGFNYDDLVGRELVIGCQEEQYEGDMNPMTGRPVVKTVTRVGMERPRSEWGKIKEQQQTKSA